MTMYMQTTNKDNTLNARPALPRKSPVAGLVLLALAIFLLLAMTIGSFVGVGTISLTYMIAVCALILCGLVLFIGSRVATFDPLEIVYPITALFILNYPMRAIFIEFWPSAAILSKYWPGDDFVSYALLISTLGIACFYLGYFVNRPGFPLNAFPKIKYDDVSYPSLEKLLVLYMVGLAAWAALLQSGYGVRFQWMQESAGAFNYIFRLLAMMKTYVLFFVWAEYLTRGSKRTMAFGLLAFEILLGLLIGSKQDILTALTGVLFAYHYLGRKNLIPVLAIVGIVFVFGLTPVVQTYRVVYSETLGYEPMPTLGEISLVVNQLGSALMTNRENWFLNTLTYVSNRAASFDTVVLIVNIVPSMIKYQQGDTLMSAFYGLIPRLLWPNKPELNLGGYVTLVIFGSKSMGNTPLTDIGEFYLNFGFYGVLAGMFILGFLFRSVYWYCLKEPNLHLYALYLLIFPILLFGQTGVGGIPVALSRVIPLSWLVTWFINLKGSRSQRGYDVR